MSIEKQEILDAFWFRHACKEFDTSKSINDEDFRFIMEGFERDGLEKVLEADMAVDLKQWGGAYMVAFGYRNQPPARPKTRQKMEAVVEWFV